MRRGKRWQLTPEGQRVRLVVADMVQRYAQLDSFVASGADGSGLVSIASGQQAAAGFVRTRLTSSRANPQARVRLSTPRGRVRIEGVAAGQFDLNGKKAVGSRFSRPIT